MTRIKWLTRGYVSQLCSPYIFAYNDLMTYLTSFQNKTYVNK